MSDIARVNIRLMTAADVDGVVEIATELRDAPQWPRSVYEDLLATSTRKRIAVVAEGAGTHALVGFAVVSVLPPEAELESIGVAAGHQRRGVAQHLWTAVVNELVRSQVGEVLLEVRAGNNAARAFYRSIGFVEEGRRVRYYADPIEDAILLRIRLE